MNEVAALPRGLDSMLGERGTYALFTEDTLTVVLPVLQRKTWGALGRMLRLWGVVLAANVAGTLAYAFVAARSDLFSAEAREAMGEIGRHAAEPGAWVTFLRAVMAGWLIALMVWLLPEAGPASPFIIVAITCSCGSIPAVARRSSSLLAPDNVTSSCPTGT